MEMVMNRGVAQQELPCTRVTESSDWHWDLGGITYHFPGMSVDYGLEGIVDLAVERAHSLGEFQQALVSN